MCSNRAGECQLQWLKGQQPSWTPDGFEDLLRSTYQSRACLVQVAEAFKSPSGRSQIYVIELWNGQEGDFVGREVLKVVDSDRKSQLEEEPRKYTKFVEDKCEGGFLAPIDKKAREARDGYWALRYKDATSVAGRPGVMVATLLDYAIDHIASEPNKIVEVLYELFQNHLNFFHSNTETENPMSPKYWRFWDRKLGLRDNQDQGMTLVQKRVSWLLSREPAASLEAENLIKNVVEARNQLAEPTGISVTVGTIHGDLNLWNVLVIEDHPYLIDLEDLESKAPLVFDFVKPEVEFINHVLFDRDPCELQSWFEVLNWITVQESGERRRDQHGLPRNWSKLALKWRQAVTSDGTRRPGVSAIAGHLGLISERRLWNVLEVVLALRSLASERLSHQEMQEYARWVALYALATQKFDLTPQADHGNETPEENAERQQIGFRKHRTALLTADRALAFRQRSPQQRRTPCVGRLRKAFVGMASTAKWMVPLLVLSVVVGVMVANHSPTTGRETPQVESVVEPLQIEASLGLPGLPESYDALQIEVGENFCFRVKPNQRAWYAIIQFVPGEPNPVYDVLSLKYYDDDKVNVKELIPLSDNLVMVSAGEPSGTDIFFILTDQTPEKVHAKLSRLTHQLKSLGIENIGLPERIVAELQDQGRQRGAAQRARMADGRAEQKLEQVRQIRLTPQDRRLIVWNVQPPKL